MFSEQILVISFFCNFKQLIYFLNFTEISKLNGDVTKHHRPLPSPAKKAKDVHSDLSTLGFYDEHLETETEEKVAIGSGTQKEEHKSDLPRGNHFNMPMQQYFNKKVAAKEVDPEEELDLEDLDVFCTNLQEYNSEQVKNTSSSKSEILSLFDEDSADSFCNGIFSSDIDISQPKINFVPKINSTPQKSLDIKLDPKGTEDLLDKTSKIFESRSKTTPSKIPSESVSKSVRKKSPVKSSPSKEPSISDFGTIGIKLK